MKDALTALELRALINELSGLIGAKIAQIYELGPSDMLFQLHLSGVGREIVRIHPPYSLFIAKDKPTIDLPPSPFVSLLRRHLTNSRVLSIEQNGFDRVLKVSFGYQKPEFTLFLEFFGKGNAVLADANGKILGALIERSFGLRSTKKGADYQLPKPPADPFLLSKDEFFSLFDKYREQAVKVLALDCSLGGAYSEQICFEANVDKSANPKELSIER